MVTDLGPDEKQFSIADLFQESEEYEESNASKSIGNEQLVLDRHRYYKHLVVLGTLSNRNL